MNKTELDRIEQKARRVASNSCGTIVSEERKGKRVLYNYGVNIDGRFYWTTEDFYHAYPSAHSKQKIYGPYRVKNIGVGGNVYMVVEMVDNYSNTWQELRPNRTYLNRQAAYGKMARLNRRWQEDYWNEPELLEYWREATN